MVTRWLRLNASTSKGIHSGAEGGITVIPLESWISPTFTVEAGHWSGGDISAVVRLLTTSPSQNPAWVRSFDYENAYLGTELGTSRVAVSLKVGLTRAEISDHNLQRTLEAAVTYFGSSNHDIPAMSISPSARVELLIKI